jgi:N-methylhydantoinase B
VIERYCLREDSGGVGQWQGGFGTEKVGRATADLMFNAQVDRVHCRPWGLFGGLQGAGNRVSVTLGDGKERSFPSGKVLARALKPGERYTLKSGGGGGYGSPLERPIEKVAADLQEGYVSRARAERFYGIVFGADAGTIDVAATVARRAEMASQGLPDDDAALEILDAMFDLDESPKPVRLSFRCC